MNTKQLYTFLRALSETVVLEHEVMEKLRKRRKQIAHLDKEELIQMQEEILQKTWRIQTLYESYFKS